MQTQRRIALNRRGTTALCLLLTVSLGGSVHTLTRGHFDGAPEESPDVQLIDAAFERASSQTSAGIVQGFEAQTTFERATSGATIKSVKASSLHPHSSGTIRLKVQLPSDVDLPDLRNLRLSVDSTIDAVQTPSRPMHLRSDDHSAKFGIVVTPPDSHDVTVLLSLTFTANYQGEEISSTQDATLTLNVKGKSLLQKISLRDVIEAAGVVVAVISVVPK
jgi:hypothetical protein